MRTASTVAHPGPQLTHDCHMVATAYSHEQAWPHTTEPASAMKSDTDDNSANNDADVNSVTYARILCCHGALRSLGLWHAAMLLPD